ncbi:MAG: ATP-dependent helicase [Lachnospiraceae bacterium]|nr:ATP-dependent helicase [Lachnospiraceae bacterium]
MRLSETLNEAQRKAVMHGEGPMLVLAGPGSGKTFVITNRISYLIEHYGVAPQNILVITFTRDAAMNMKNRFHESTAVPQPVNFGTFHAIFYQMLKRSGYRQADTILTDSDKKRYMIPILTDYIREFGQNSFRSDQMDEDALRCLAAISFYKNTGNQENAAKMLEEPYRAGFQRLLVRYEEKRKRCGRMDFDDMLYLCQKMLEEDADVLKRWQDQFTYLLIDEYQDINPRQNEIIKLLAGKQRNLFVVGDDDQSIYGFRGAKPALMNQFLTDYPDCKQVLLDTNYRSVPEIVDASGKVIRENKNRLPKKFKAAMGSSMQNRIFIQSFIDKPLEYQFLVKQFKACALQELNGTAVLFRTNAQMQSFASVLIKAGIPFQMKEKGNCIYDHFVAKDIRNYIMFACGDVRRSLFLTIMNKPYRLINREVLTEELVSFDRIRAYYCNYLPKEKLARHLFALGELEDGLRRMAGLSPYLGVQYLRRRMGYEAYLSKKAGTDSNKLDKWLEVLEFLSAEAGGFSQYSKWLEYQDAFRKEMAEKAAQKEGEGVSLMTVHASKGLEFEQVWIPDLNEGVFPHGCLPSKETVEEERRLLYVAMTRAKKNLGLTYVTGTKERPRPMSRFLKPLKELV